MTKSKVTFFQYVCVLKIDSLDSYTPEEKQSCWHNADEMKRIHMQLSRDTAILEMKRQVFPSVVNNECHCNNGADEEDEKDEESTSLGLITRIGKQLRKRVRQATTDAVLDEQEGQWVNGIFDEEAIAKAYRDAMFDRVHLRETCKYSHVMPPMIRATHSRSAVPPTNSTVTARRGVCVAALTA